MIDFDIKKKRHNRKSTVVGIWPFVAFKGWEISLSLCWRCKQIYFKFGSISDVVLENNHFIQVVINSSTETGVSVLKFCSLLTAMVIFGAIGIFLLKKVWKEDNRKYKYILSPFSW